MSSLSLVFTPGGSLRGELAAGEMLSLPGDKSLSHRAALFAALAEGTSRVSNFLVSGVTRTMLGALSDLEIPWELEDKRLHVQGVGLRGPQPGLAGVRIDCGNSATTLRLLAGALAAWGFPAVLDGSPGLRRRPMRRIIQPLQQMGAVIEGTEGCAPLILRKPQNSLYSLDYMLPVASAQVKSCLLLASLAADGNTTLREPGPSRDHSERMLRGMGVDVSSEQCDYSEEAADTYGRGKRMYITRLIPPPSGTLAPLNMTLPGDISAAAFLIVAALITPGSQITIMGVGLNPTRTGLLDALKQMGADLRVVNQRESGGEPIGDLTVCYSSLRGTSVSGEMVVRMIDEFPAFAVAAAFAQGTTVVSEAVELRHKESDRISALCQELHELKVDISETPDGFIVRGGQPMRGGIVHSHGDHRLAMSLGVAGLAACEAVTVMDAQVIGESFPEFVPVLDVLGAQVLQENQ